MFKDALKLSLQIVFSQNEAWTMIAVNDKKLLKKYLLPIWALILGSSLIGSFFISKEGSLELGVKSLLTEGFILFSSFYITSYVFNEYIGSMLVSEKDLKRSQVFVAFSSSLIYLLSILVAIFNDLFFLWLFSFYTFFIVYAGAGIYYKIQDENKTKFSLISTILIIGIPLLLRLCLSIFEN